MQAALMIAVLTFGGARDWSVGVIHQNVRGSGTVIWMYPNRPGVGQVLTAAHWQSDDGPFEVLVARRNKLPANVIAIDHERDLLLLEVDFGRKIKPVKIGTRTPPYGLDLILCGYGNGTYSEHKTYIKGKDDRGRLLIEAATQPGDSGAGLIWGDKLVGVHQSGNKKDGLEIPIDVVREFLEEECGWKFDD